MADIPKIDSDDDPDRCQGVNTSGQCRNKKMGSSDFCVAHGGNRANQVAEKQALMNYRLDKWNARLQQLGTSPNIKSLRDEIAILRMLMEERLNQCKVAKDLIYQSGPISDLVMKIDKTVNSCHKLENAMGALLDKQAILNFGSRLVNLIADEVTDEEALTRISAAIIKIVSDTIGEKEDA